MVKNRTTHSPRCLDFFCGIGGLTLGFELAGIQTLGGIDCWEDAKRTFDHNLSPRCCMLSDLTQTTISEIEDFFKFRRNKLTLLLVVHLVKDLVPLAIEIVLILAICYGIISAT